MDAIIKYPRTPHLQGSRLHPGDIDDGIKLSSLPEGHVFQWEEKVDGANSGISFDDDGNLILQSRGHQLRGGPRERQFDMFKAWANGHLDAIFDVLGSRYIAYCEYMAAKHTVFYDALEHLVFEEDIFDKEEGVFLSTQRRQALLAGSPFVSVPVLHEGRLTSEKQVKALIKRSLYQTENWRENLSRAAETAGVDPAQALAETDGSELSEGLYLKVEDPETQTVVGRYKWVRASFVQTILESGSHWQARPLIFNGLAPGVDIMHSPARTAALTA